MIKEIGQALQRAAGKSAQVLEAAVLYKGWMELADIKSSVVGGRAVDFLIGAREWRSVVKTVASVGQVLAEEKTRVSAPGWATTISGVAFGITNSIDIVATRVFGGKWGYLPRVQQAKEVAIIALEVLEAKRLWDGGAATAEPKALTLVGKCRFAAAGGYVVLGSLALWRPTNTMFVAGSLACYTVETMLDWCWTAADSFGQQKKK